jgi:hypothetical protein
MRIWKAIGMALVAAGMRLEVPRWPIDYDPGVCAIRDAESGSLPSDPREWFDRFTVPDLNSWPPWARRRKTAYRELVELVERAKDLTANAQLGPEQIRAMLTDARAPIPEAADALASLAADCLTLTLEEVHRQRLFNHEARQRGWREVKAAAETLRQVLPYVIVELKGYGNLERHRISAIRRVLKQLDGLDLSMPSVGQVRRSWAIGAISLARTYIAAVDPETGWSRDGPAVRFLVRALNRAYPGQNVSAGAIAIELNRQKTRIA